MENGEAIVGFAIRARKVIFGTDKIESSRQKKLIIIDKDLSDNALKKMIKSANSSGISLLMYSKSLEELVCKLGVKAIAIADVQMSKTIEKDTINFKVIELNN